MRQHRRGGARRSRESDEPWAALGARSARRALRLRRARARESRTSPTTSPASSGSRRAAPQPDGDGAWRTSLVFSELGDDHPGALVEALTEFSDRERQPDPDRVAAAAPRARPLHVLRRPRGAERRSRRSPRRSRGCATRPSRCGCSAATRSPSGSPGVSLLARIRAPWLRHASRRLLASRGRPSPGRGTGRRDVAGGRPASAGPRPQRDLRADQRLHRPPRRGSGPEGEGRGARARRAASCARSGSRSTRPA